MPDHDKSFALLGYIVIHGIQNPVFQYISQIFKPLKNLFKVRFALIEQAADILENENLGSQGINGLNENGEAISGIVQSALFSNYTERLAWGAANQNLCGGQWRFRGKHYIVTFAAQVLPISRTACGIHLISMSFEALSLESKRQPAAAGK